MWLSKLGVDTIIGLEKSAPQVEIGLGRPSKLGVDTSPRPHAHRHACIGLEKNLCQIRSEFNPLRDDLVVRIQIQMFDFKRRCRNVFTQVQPDK